VTSASKANRLMNFDDYSNDRKLIGNPNID